MLPTHSFRFPACPSSRVQSVVYSQERDHHEMENGSGLSPSEIVKRKLHQRLMAGQAKKRRLSESNVPLGIASHRPQVADVDRPCEGIKSEPRNEDGEEKTAVPGTERGMSVEDSPKNSLCSGKCSEDNDVHRTLVHLGIRNIQDESRELKYCIKHEGRRRREGPQPPAGRAKEASLNEVMNALGDSPEREAMAARIEGFHPFHEVIGRLDNFSYGRSVAQPNVSSSFISTRPSLPPSVSIAPFSSTMDTTNASKSADPVEKKPDQHIMTNSVDRMGVSVADSAYDDSMGERTSTERLPPSLTAFEEFSKEPELHNLKKKKSRRTPKVKKIKFHEYKGPHRRSLVPKPKSVQSNRLSQVDRPSSTNSLHLPIAKANSQNSSNVAVNFIPSALEKSTNLFKNMAQTETAISPREVLTSLQIDQPSVGNESHHIDEAERLKCLLKLGRQNFLDFGRCVSTSEPTALINAVLSQTCVKNPTIGCSSSACVGKPVAPTVAKAGTSAPLLVTAASRRKDAFPCVGSRLVNTSEKKIYRRDSAAVLSAPVTLDDLKVIELKQECKKRKLSVTGPKPRLVNRLMPYSDAILCQKTLSTINTSVDSRSNSYLSSNGKITDFRSSPSIPELKIMADIPCRSRPISPTIHGKVPAVLIRRNVDNEDDDDDKRSTSEPCSNSPEAVCSSTSKSSTNGTLNSEQTGVGGDIPRRQTTATSSADDNAATSNNEIRTKAPFSSPSQSINRPSYAMEKPDSNVVCKVQQQLLTPVATPTLVSSHIVAGYPQCEVPRSADRATEEARIACKNGVEFKAASSRWLCRVTSNGIPVTLTDSELWMIQDRQILELQLQLQKSKAELICARRKACLEKCNDFLPLGALIEDSASECSVPNCLSEEAQLALSIAIENAEHIFSNLKRHDCHVTERAQDSISDIAAVRPNSNDENSACQKHGILPFTVDDSHGLIPASKRAGEESKDEAIDCGSQTKLLTSALPSDGSNLERKDYLYESTSNLNGMSETLAIDDEADRPDQISFHTSPVKKPPDYYEAIRQKLFQSEGVAGQRDTGTVSLSTASTDGSGGCGGLSPAEAMREEEIEDVLEVLLRSGELSATDIQSERLLWQQDPVINIPQDFLSTKHGQTGIDSNALLKDLRSPHQRYMTQNSKPHWASENAQSFGCPAGFTGERQFDTRMEDFSYRGSKAPDAVAMLGSSLAMISSVKEETPSSIELPEFFFDWNDAEPNLRFNALHPWDSYPSPDESILCPTPNRDVNVSDSSVNGSFTEWKSNTIPGFRTEHWSAVTPCNSTTSSGCESTSGDDAMVVEHQFLTDGSLGILSPGMTPASANTVNDVENDFTGDVLSKTHAFLKESQAGNEWMEVFMDSNHFLAPTHLTGSNASDLHTNFSFSQGFYVGENGQSHLVQ